MPGDTQPEAEDRVAVEAAQPAVEVADAGRGTAARPMKLSTGLPRIAVQRRHRARARCRRRSDCPSPAASPARRRSTKAVEAREVVAVVGVAHDDVAAAGRRDAGDQRRAVAALGHRHDPRARCLGERAASRRSSRCRRRPPRRRCRSRCRNASALPTQTPTVSASFEAGHQHGEVDFGSAYRASRTRPPRHPARSSPQGAAKGSSRVRRSGRARRRAGWNGAGDQGRRWPGARCEKGGSIARPAPLLTFRPVTIPVTARMLAGRHFLFSAVAGVHVTEPPASAGVSVSVPAPPPPHVASFSVAL